MIQKSAPFGRFPTSLVRSTNEAFIRNISTLENTAESTAKVIAAQQKSLDSMAKVVLDKRIAPDYLLAKGYLWPTPLAVPGLTLLEKLKLSYLPKVTEQATWLKKATPGVPGVLVD